jgi:hypothetical protein
LGWMPMAKRSLSQQSDIDVWRYVFTRFIHEKNRSFYAVDTGSDKIESNAFRTEKNAFGFFIKSDPACDVLCDLSHLMYVSKKLNCDSNGSSSLFRDGYSFWSVWSIKSCIKELTLGRNS